MSNMHKKNDVMNLYFFYRFVHLLKNIKKYECFLLIIFDNRRLWLSNWESALDEYPVIQWAHVMLYNVWTVYRTWLVLICWTNDIKYRNTWKVHFAIARIQVNVEQELLLSLLEHLSSPLVFIGVRVAQSLVFCVVFCRSLFVFFSIFFPFFCHLNTGI